MTPFRALSTPEQNAEIARIVAVYNTDTDLIGSALKHIADVLEQDEVLIAMIQGRLERPVISKDPIQAGLGTSLPQLIALSDRRILAVRKRMFGAATATSFWLDQIGEVSGSKGVLRGAIHVRMMGETWMIAGVRKASIEPFIETAMSIIDMRRNAKASDADASVEIVEIAVTGADDATSSHTQDAEQAAPASAAVPSAPDEISAETSGTTSQIADEIEKLASLLDRGILTPEEFAQRKAKLLDL